MASETDGKKKRSVKQRSFRLFDFTVRDAYEEKDEEDEEEEEEETNKKAFTIQMFGINERGNTCSITVKDFEPFFFIKGSSDQYAVLELLRAKVSWYHAKSILRAEVVDSKKLYGFTAGRTFPFVKVTFATVAAMNKTKRIWCDDDGKRRRPVWLHGCRLELYESHIPPLLRYFHIHNMSPSGWILLRTDRDAAIPAMKRTTCTYEWTVPWRNVTADPTKEARVPYKICSFDIEASSSHGDFPLPVKTYKRLATNLLDVGLRQGKVLEANFIKRVILTAFGYDVLEDVDRVYPKRMPTKDEVKSIWTNRLVTQTIHQDDDDDDEAIFDIDRMFHRQDDSDDSEEEETDKKKKKKKKKVTDGGTIVQVINHPKLSREVKIQLVNEALTRALPRLEGDCVTYIGSTFLRYGEKEPYLQHCLVTGAACDPVDGVVVESAPSERDLLLAWRELMDRENPDIIIGYNIFGFDWEFLFRRSQELECMDDFLQLSRNVGECGATRNFRTQKPQLENTKIVLATGEYDLRYPKLTGRLQIDMYTYFRRDFNLASYKLDDVAAANIGDAIFRVQPTSAGVTELYTRNMTGLHAGDFIHIEICGFTSDYYGHKFRVLALHEDHIVVPGQLYDLLDYKKIKWGVAKDDLTPQDLFRMSKGTPAERALVAKYCIQDCNLVHHLMTKLDVMTGYAEMARICSVPMSFLVFRGQGIKLTSFVAKKCREKNTLIPDLDKGDDDIDGGYEGAIVLPPKCAMYMDNPVACVDYSSLYPSSMISQNYSHDSKVWTKEYDLDGNLVHTTGKKNAQGDFVYDNLPGYQYIDITFDTYAANRKSPTSRPEKTRVGKKTCRWAQTAEKSIMPAILEELLQARKQTRKAAEAETDPFMANILDKRQLGYKITANSLYGQCGARTSTFYEQDVAASTTATGREMIMYAKHMVEEVYGHRIVGTTVLCKAEYVYGDTDSVFFTLNLEDVATGNKIRGPQALELTIVIAQEVAKLCTQFLKPPMELSYEKTLMPFILLSKKRYVGMLYETDVTKGKLKYMGLSIKRRDSCDYLKDVYGGVLNLLMAAKPVEEAMAFVDGKLEALIRGEVPMEKLTITKALRSDYKNPLQIGHWVLAERIGQRDAGNKPKAGDRMRFVFVEGAGKMGERIETPEWVVAQGLKVDYAHYITNQLMKPLQQLFGLALANIWRDNAGAMRMFLRDMATLEREGTDSSVVTKKKEKYCAEKIKTLMFEKFLIHISNDQQRLQSIKLFFQCA